MQVVSLKICPFVQRVIAQLAARDVEHEVTYIEGGERPGWFLDLSPHGQVPVLVTDDGVSLFESDAIVEWIDETQGPLRPGLSPEERAHERAWSYLATKNYLVQCSAQRSPTRATLTERSEKLERAFDTIEEKLGKGPFFGGGEVGLVDVAWLPLLHRSDIIERKTGHDFLGDRSKLSSWRERLMGTALVEASVAPDFEDVFSAFYLSEETFLGRGEDVASASSSSAPKTSRCG
ncbi:MAG: glutathione S-transferase family protein [Acidobacteriota bacterium]